MAKQTGMITISGKLGNVVHYQRGKNHFSKSISHHKHRFSEGSLAAQQCFGLGSAMGKQIKLALQPLLSRYKYEGIHNRLTEACKQIFRAGPVRKVESNLFTDYNIRLLEGFNFNKYTPFDTLLFHHPIQLHYGQDGTVTLSIAAHIPRDCFFHNSKTQTVAYQLLFSMLDIENSTYDHFLVPEITIPLSKPFAKKEGKIQLPPLANKLLLCCSQIRYYCNGEMKGYSDNRKLIAAEISHVGYLENGEWVDYPLLRPIPKPEPEQKESAILPIHWD